MTQAQIEAAKDTIEMLNDEINQANADLARLVALKSTLTAFMNDSYDPNFKSEYQGMLRTLSDMYHEKVTSVGDWTNEVTDLIMKVFHATRHNG
jgi:hypothetical protein